MDIEERLSQKDKDWYAQYMGYKEFRYVDFALIVSRILYIQNIIFRLTMKGQSHLEDYKILDTLFEWYRNKMPRITRT